MATAIFKVIWDRKKGRPMIPKMFSSTEDERVDNREVQLRYEDRGPKGGYSVVGDLTEQLARGDIVEVQIEASQAAIDAMKAERGEVEVDRVMLRRFEHVRDISVDAVVEPITR